MEIESQIESPSLSSLLITQLLNNESTGRNRAAEMLARLNISNLMNSSINQTSPSWSNIFDKQTTNPSVILQNPPAFNLWSLLQTQQMAPNFSFLFKTIPEYPLDLSNKNFPTLNQFGLNNSVIDTDVKTEIRPSEGGEAKTSSTVTGRRNYTLEELNQAVEDIRQGKLGTRRASVVYGIPRSTLRNKIYKLEAEGITSCKLRRGKKSPLIPNTEFDIKNSKHDLSESSSSSPRLSLYPSSPDSTNSYMDGNINPSGEQKSCSPITDLKNNSWIDSLWQNLFKNQTIKMDILEGTSNKTNPTDVFYSKNKKSSVTEEWKRSRPKRGQYRKYDKNALDEAVRSVRRGEMSVHRAGSYFGVPHSTLEYKVKERNLLRKKKDGFQLNGAAENHNEESSSLVSSTNSEKQEDQFIKSQHFPVSTHSKLL